MLGRFLKRGTGADPGPSENGFPRPATDEVVYAIGDVHGRSDLLDRMIGMVDADAAETGAEAPRIVMLGDYVDRGHDSRGVIARAVALDEDADRRVTCLLGNHEDMMREFLDQTGSRGHVWLDNGGFQTLESYGVDGLYAERDAAAMSRAAEQLAEAMGERYVTWLRALPRQDRSGNVHFVHAMADPARPMDEQDPEMLIWGRPLRRTPPRSDGQWIVHGHTPSDVPHLTTGRINVDTGAVFSGRLSAVRLDPGGDIRFLST